MSDKYEIRAVKDDYVFESYPDVETARKRFAEIVAASATEDLADGVKLVELIPVILDIIKPKKKVDKS